MCEKTAAVFSETAAAAAFSPLEQQMMREALALARLALARDEVPVGAVIYSAAGDLIAGGYNQTIAAGDVSAHAEIIALRRAARQRRNHRLPDLRMAVTLEPCVMCIGAVFHARLQQLLFGAPDPKCGACGKIVNLPAYKTLNHHTQVSGGLYDSDAAALLRAFFAARRPAAKRHHAG